MESLGFPIYKITVATVGEGVKRKPLHSLGGMYINTIILQKQFGGSSQN